MLDFKQPDKKPSNKPKIALEHRCLLINYKSFSTVGNGYLSTPEMNRLNKFNASKDIPIRWVRLPETKSRPVKKNAK